MDNRNKVVEEQFSSSYVPTRKMERDVFYESFKPIVKTPMELAQMRPIEFLFRVKQVKWFYTILMPRHLYIHVPSSRFDDTRTRPCIALPGFSKGLGDCYLLVPEHTFSIAMNKAKDKSKHRKTYPGVWKKKFPYVLLDIQSESKMRYNITIIEKWSDKEEFVKELNSMREEMF